ncbi:YbaK/EbsC family protein [Streptomyces fulvoviolaceus]|uniref:YbaK/EbsC family protein n=1 Tax=Streptomyces fulvoviolaceus TaxID=285535 RepID=UPI0004CACDBA|nr:YbaK/EbsC family protein [Streptomyces fulvoviolaceus]
MPDDSANGAYDRLISLLDTSSVDYKLIDHAPEGTTDAVCALRGHPASEAAKCIVLRVKVDQRTTRHVLAVVPGDRRVDLDAVRTLFAALPQLSASLEPGTPTVGFSDAETAERLARAIPGTVLPFSFDPELEVVADPNVVAQPRLYFNAARLDRSLFISGADYARVAQPRVEPIAGPVPA